MSCCKSNSKIPKIGELRFPIEIIDKTLVAKDCDVTFDVESKLTTKAKIEDANTRDRKIFDDTNLGVQITDIFYIRYTDLIEADDLIEWDGKYYIIQGYVDIDKLKRFLKIYATERGTTTNKRNQL